MTTLKDVVFKAMGWVILGVFVSVFYIADKLAAYLGLPDIEVRDKWKDRG